MFVKKSLPLLQCNNVTLLVENVRSITTYENCTLLYFLGVLFFPSHFFFSCLISKMNQRAMKREFWRSHKHHLPSVYLATLLKYLIISVTQIAIICQLVCNSPTIIECILNANIVLKREKKRCSNIWQTNQKKK